VALTIANGAIIGVTDAAPFGALLHGGHSAAPLGDRVVSLPLAAFLDRR
jgi:hypothetical protein